MVEAQHLGVGTGEALLCAFNQTRGIMLATNVKTATTLLDRRCGLLNRDDLRIGEGLHIVPCSSIHTVGMKFPIDVVFLDENGLVLATWRDVQPGRTGISCDRAVSALEVPTPVLDATNTQAGDTLEFAEVAC